MSMRSELIRVGRERFAVQLSFAGEDSKTKQSFVAECDVNNIMAKWKRTGVMEHMASNPPTFGDFDQAIDYQTAQNMVAAADAAFQALPAHIRERMGNNPQTFVEFMTNEDNYQEAVQLGLIEEREPVLEPTPGVVDPPPEAEPPVEETP